MPKKPARPPLDEAGYSRLLERIESRYAQLEEKLDELEAQLPQLDALRGEDDPNPRKPR